MREVDLALDAAAWRELAAFVHLPETTSTQDAAFAQALPSRGALVVVADRQSDGRGRRGRRWYGDAQGDAERTLALTVLRRFDLPPRALATLGPALGVVVASALRDLGVEVGLKWPNDLLHDGAKFGGLLVEARGSVVAIGIGLNLALKEAPDIDQPWTDLQRAGLASPSRPVVLSALLNGLLPALVRFEREGFAAFHADWEAVDVLVGRAVCVLAGVVRCEGEALGITEDGGLRVRHADGERVHHAGEVSVRVVV